MEISIQKYKWLFNELNPELTEVLCQLIPNPWGHLDNDLKYLGYFLKPNNYHVAYWKWMYKNISDRISC